MGIEWKLVKSINHLKEFCDINGRAEFYIILGGGLSKSGMQIHYDTELKEFDIYNELDDTWQERIKESELFLMTNIPEAIGKNAMFFCGVQLFGLK